MDVLNQDSQPIITWFIFKVACYWTQCVIRFLHVFSVSVTYKIGKSDFNIIFLPDSTEKNYHALVANYFLVEIFFKSIVWIMRLVSYLTSRAFFSQKNPTLINLVNDIIVSLTRCCVLYYLWKFKQSANLR